MRMRGVGAGVLVVVGLGAGKARAQEARPPIQLRWQAPAECPDDLALLRSIEDFLGQSVTRAGEQQLKIDAHVMGDAAHGYAAKVAFSTATATSERSIEHLDCAKVTEAAALLIALAIDPERVRALHEQRNFSVVDAGSKNRTYLNGEALPARRAFALSPGDSIRFGSVATLVCEAEALWSAVHEHAR